MFTGLIEVCVPVRRLERRGAGARLALEAPAWAGELEAGASVAVSGACLSVLEKTVPGGELAFDLSAETLERTWLGRASAGKLVNLERSLRLADRLDGHLVSGHVDGLGRVVSVEDSQDGGRRIVFELEPGLERWLIDKGSIALDGISLTVVEPRGARFGVAVIPLTLAKTSLGRARPGDEVHVEGDLVAKWIERLARRP